jgi:hypothetical protein
VISKKKIGANNFAANVAAVSANQSVYHPDGLFSFQDAVNLISLFSAEVLLHSTTSTWWLKRLWCQGMLSHQLQNSLSLHIALESAPFKSPDVA